MTIDVRTSEKAKVTALLTVGHGEGKPETMQTVRFTSSPGTGKRIEAGGEIIGAIINVSPSP
jgi:hypothetical protein